MRFLDSFRARLTALFRRPAVNRELEEELRSHIAHRADDLEREGLARPEAERRARMEFGGYERYRQESHEAAGGLLVASIVQDIRFGMRMMGRNTGFTCIAVFALALGIGVNTVAFTALKAILARSLDAREPRRMVNLELERQDGGLEVNFSYPDYLAYRDSLHSLSGVIAYSVDTLSLSGVEGAARQRRATAGTLAGKLGLIPTRASDAEFATVYEISENYFSVLGVPALRGRTFDSVPPTELTATPSVLISENYWQRRFANDPAVLGKVVRLNGAAFTIIGITPHDFVGTGITTPDFWFPLSLQRLVHPNDDALRDRENTFCRIFGRLAASATMDQAKAEMTAVAGHLRVLHSAQSPFRKPMTAVVWPGSPYPRKLDNWLMTGIVFIMVAVGLVLVVACANVASLQLARAASRQNELCMRLSLGAGRVRLVRQLLTESALLGLIAGVFALLASWGLLRVAVTLAAEAIPAEAGSLVLNITPDIGIFAFVFSVSLVAGVLFGLAPALESSRSALSLVMHAGTGNSPRRSRRLRDGLIAAQVAVSLMLLICGSLLVRSAIHVLKMDTGYDAKLITQLEVQFPEGGKYNKERRHALVKHLGDELAGLPSVAAVTSARPPDGGGVRTAAVSLDGHEPSSRNTRAVLYYTFVQPNYFAALGIPLLGGRGFAAQAGDHESAVILSHAAAEQLWPGQNPIGKTLRLGTTGDFYHAKGELLPDGPAYQVIGVARDVRGIQLDGGDAQQVYVPLPESRIDDYPLLVRSYANASQLPDAIGGVAASIDPAIVVTTETLDQMLRQTPPFLIASTAAMIATIVGGIGLLLAAMGIFGTVSYIVVLRTKEMGVRIALGARRHHILELMMRECTRPVALGLIAGSGLAVGASYLLRGILYGLGRVDGVSFAGVGLLFVSIAAIAVYLPSRRAMRVDPMEALRHE